MSYLGNTPTTSLFGTKTDSYNGDGSTVNFTLSREVVNEEDLEVIVNNVQQSPIDAYTVSGTTLTFTEAPSSGTSNILVTYRNNLITRFSPSDDTVTAAVLQANSVTTTKIADGAVTGAKIAANTIPSANLTTTGVSSGSYGGSSSIPTFTVDTAGRMSYAANIALSLNSITGNLSVSGNVRAKTYEETLSNVSIASGNVTINLSNATVFTTVVTSAANVIITSPPPNLVAFSFIIQLQQTGSYAITWPSSIQWPSNTAPTLSTTNGYRDTIALYTIDGGNNYWATSVLGQF